MLVKSIDIGVIGALLSCISEQACHDSAGRGLPRILAIGDGRR